MVEPCGAGEEPGKHGGQDRRGCKGTRIVGFIRDVLGICYVPGSMYRYMSL